MIIQKRLPAVAPRHFTRLFATSLANKSTFTGQEVDTPSSEIKFHGNTTVSDTAEDRMTRVFGGRIKGEARVSTSRTEVGEPRLIAGVMVPDKPKEPDNCCMSGCVNCVWEQYNDDIRDWRKASYLAAEKINKTDQIWPEDFHPPLKKLELKNVPKSFRNQKRKLERAQRVTTASYFPASGKPGAQNITKGKDEEEEATKLSTTEDDEWANVPVAFKVFAETERRVKEKKKQKQKEKEERSRKLAREAEMELEV